MNIVLIKLIISLIMFCLLKKGLFIVDYLLKKIEVLNVKNEK